MFTTVATVCRASSAGPAVACATAQVHKLDLDKHGLRLLDADARVLDRVALRGKRWDQRTLPDGSPIALLHDADSGDLLLVPITLLGIALSGRLLSLALTGFSPPLLQPIVVEAVLLVIMVLGYRSLARPQA